ncbi:phosphomannomutase [Ensifer sp. 22564]|uniref:phosphomannomutase n=1 Tax=Ensifer sp. 22564 TaxID=3453943 RepID=UPI003F87E481
MSLKFGTSGLRGVALDLRGKATAAYSDAFARHLIRSGMVNLGDRVLISRDYRESSPDIAATAIGALERAGLVPLDCGCLPTPALALFALSLKAPSLMITGSHIPANRNGIKFYRPDGEINKIDEQIISEIARSTNDIDDAPGVAEDRSAECAEHFYQRNASLLPSRALSGLRIGVYQHSTVARDLLVDVLVHYGAEVTALGRSEKFVPVDTEAVSAETVALLSEWTKDYKFDAIVSADGDGDRPLVADENGKPLRGDLLGLICARFLGATYVATPVTSNSHIEMNGTFKVVRTQVGSPFVIAAMDAGMSAGEMGVIGFEANGGLLTASPFLVNGHRLAALPTRDCFLPILALLYLASRENKRISAISHAFGMPVALADRLENYPIEASNALMARLRASPDNLSSFLAPFGDIAAVNDTDGLRVQLTVGNTIHFRPSGNAPEMRCYVEAATEEAAARMLEMALGLLRNAVGNQ